MWDSREQRYRVLARHAFMMGGESRGGVREHQRMGVHGVLGRGKQLPLVVLVVQDVQLLQLLLMMPLLLLLQVPLV